jgi:3-phenylpropionate/trans-cinnamate dioxygenase ferredoxin reductase subunit
MLRGLAKFMRDFKYLLIGGGVACFQAAKQIRRTDPSGSVLVVSDEPLPPYDRPPMSKEYLLGKKSVADVVYEPAETLAEQRIELALSTRVEKIEPATSIALLANGEAVRFEKALIATGGRPVRLNLPGASHSGVHYLRSAADADSLAFDAHAATGAVVIGGGFIGLEVAASLRRLGLEVTVIEALPYIWARFANQSLSGYVQGYCEERGVRFITGERVSEFRGDGRLEAVVTGSGEVVPCQVVCIGVGIVPNVELAVNAGLIVDNGIVVNEKLETSHAGIYAAGDVVNYFDPLFGKRRRVEHWGHAEYTGQIAGRNMAGENQDYDFLTYVWSDIFDLHLEFAGDESEHDRALLRGSLSEGSFMIIYMKAGLVTAFFAVNVSPREFAAVRQLIRQKKDLSGRESELQDANFNLRGLV